jgi:hypothetical protein
MNPAGTLEMLAPSTVNPAGTSKTTQPIISLPSVTVAEMLVCTPSVIDNGASASVQGFAARTDAGMPGIVAKPSQTSASSAARSPLRADIRRPDGPKS